MSNPLRIWCNQYFNETDFAEFQRRAQPHTLIMSASSSKSNLVAGARDPVALTCDVLYGQPNVDDIFESKHLKWVQLSTAGYTRYDREDIRAHFRKNNIIFCNASTLYDEPCAQHIVAMMLALARALPQSLIDQQTQAWNYLPLRGLSYLLRGQTVLIAGYGTIATRLVELLEPYNLNIIGFRRSPRGTERVTVYPISKIDEFLPQTDQVINILPAATDTNHFFNTRRFSLMKPGTIYFNIGRGDTTDQTALFNALSSNHLRYAYLDVTTPEPLPKDHPLWHTPTCYITPHTAGGTKDEPRRMMDHFLENIKSYDYNNPLSDRLV